MIYVYKNNIESEAETELEEEWRTDPQKTDGFELFGVSPDPPNKEKVLIIAKKKIKNFLPLMMDADQSNIESVEEMELVEVGKMDFQKKWVSDTSQDKNKAYQTKL